MTQRIVLGGILCFTVLLATQPLQGQEFIAEDTATFGQGHYRLAAFPNSIAEFDVFRSYLSASVGTEDFEGIDLGTTNPSLVFSGAGTASLSGSGSVQTPPAGEVSENGVYGTSGSRYFRVDASQVFEIDFSDPVAAFGFFATDVGDYGAQLFLEFTHLSGSTTGITVDHVRSGSGTGLTGGYYSGSVLFYGRIDTVDPYTSVRFTSSGSEGFGFDDMTIASVEQVEVVPEPATLLLLASGLLGLGVVAARRRPEDQALPG